MQNVAELPGSRNAYICIILFPLFALTFTGIIDSTLSSWSAPMWLQTLEAIDCFVMIRMRYSNSCPLFLCEVLLGVFDCRLYRFDTLYRFYSCVPLQDIQSISPFPLKTGSYLCASFFWTDDRHPTDVPLHGKGKWLAYLGRCGLSMDTLVGWQICC